MPLIRQVAIAGIGESGYFRRGTAPYGESGLALRAILAACADARVDPKDIDGFASYAHDNHDAAKLGPALGVRQTCWSSMVWGGGGGGLAGALAAAAAAITAGHARCVVVARALAERDSGRLGSAVSSYHMSSHYRAHGVVAPAQICALRARRLFDCHGVPEETMRAVTQADYFHAANNPRAAGRATVADDAAYEASRLISEPFRLLDCSRENDGAAAIVVTSAEDASVAGRPTPHVVAAVEGAPAGWGELTENDDDYESAGYRSLAARLWVDTGLRPADIDVVQVYENFSGSAVAALIDVGFCTEGEAGEFLTLENLIAPEGRLPINTAGGNIGEGFVHGIGLIVEAVRQVRGESTNQVRDVRYSMVIGGPMAPLGSIAIISPDPLAP